MRKETRLHLSAPPRRESARIRRDMAGMGCAVGKVGVYTPLRRGGAAMGWVAGKCQCIYTAGVGRCWFVLGGGDGGGVYTPRR